MPKTKYTFRPLPGGQSSFLRDEKTRYVALSGGFGSGKTWGGAAKLSRLHAINNAGRAKVPSVAVAPTYQLSRDIMVPALMDVLDSMSVGYTWKSSDSEFIIPGCGPIMVRTADKPDRLTGFEVGAFWGDEAARWKTSTTNPKDDPMMQLEARLRHPRARIKQGCYTTTQEGNRTGFYRMFSTPSEDRRLFVARTAQNPHVREFYEGQLRTLPAHLVDQYLEGGVLVMGGRNAYPSFSQGNVQAVELDRSKPIIFSIDFNINPGCHAYAMQHQHASDQIGIAREYHLPSMTSRMAAEAFCEDYRGCDVLIHGDPAGGGRDFRDGKTEFDFLKQVFAEQDMGKVSLKVARAHPRVRTRVNTVNAALCDVRGERHCYIDPSCKRLIEDFQQVVWHETKDEIDKSDQKLTHGSDAVGYPITILRPLRTDRTDNGGQFGFGAPRRF